VAQSKNQKNLEYCEVINELLLENTKLKTVICDIQRFVDGNKNESKCTKPGADKRIDKNVKTDIVNIAKNSKIGNVSKNVKIGFGVGSRGLPQNGRFGWTTRNENHKNAKKNPDENRKNVKKHINERMQNVKKDTNEHQHVMDGCVVVGKCKSSSEGDNSEQHQGSNSTKMPKMSANKNSHFSQKSYLKNHFSKTAEDLCSRPQSKNSHSSDLSKSLHISKDSHFSKFAHSFKDSKNSHSSDLSKSLHSTKDSRFSNFSNFSNFSKFAHSSDIETKDRRHFALPTRRPTISATPRNVTTETHNCSVLPTSRRAVIADMGDHSDLPVVHDKKDRGFLNRSSTFDDRRFPTSVAQPFGRHVLPSFDGNKTSRRSVHPTMIKRRSTFPVRLKTDECDGLSSSSLICSADDCLLKDTHVKCNQYFVM